MTPLIPKVYLGRDTGQSPDRQREEARRLIQIIRDTGYEGKDHRENEFLCNTMDRFDRYGDRTVIDGKVLMWLRDIRDRAIGAE